MARNNDGDAVPASFRARHTPHSLTTAARRDGVLITPNEAAANQPQAIAGRDPSFSGLRLSSSFSLVADSGANGARGCNSPRPYLFAPASISAPPGAN